MAANSVFASAVQILCVLARRPQGEATAEDVSRSLPTNPVVVRRILKQLAGAGLVEIRRGRHGGVALSRDAEAISLREIRSAVDEGGIFALRERGNPRCPVSRAMPAALGAIFAEAENAVDRSLGVRTLASIVAQIE